MTNIISTLPQLNQPGVYNACKGALYIVSPKTAINLCINPSFETGLTNWTNVGGTFIQDTVPWSGAFCANFTAGTSITYGIASRINATAGQQLAVSFYIRNQSATAQTYTIQLVNYSTGLPVATWTHTAQPNAWQRFVGVSLITATAEYYFNVVGTNFYIDAVQVEVVAGHTATTYFDGSTAGTVAQNQIAAPQYSWQGKAHNSPSVRNVNAAGGGLLVNLQNELGFIVVGIIGGDIPSYDNQTVKYFGTDGASLQDIITPPRALTIVGRIYGATREELHSKIATFTEYFSRDTTAYRQPKTYVFQHINDAGDAVGVPMTFSGVTTNAFQVPLSNDLGVQVSIQLSMIDPYFYGHDEAARFMPVNQRIQQAAFSYVPEYTQQSGTFSQYLQTAGYVNGTVTAMVIGLNGIVYFGGAFTSVGGVAMNYIASYNPVTNAFAGLTATPSTALNGSVSALAITPDGAHLIVGGTFTTASGAAANRVVGYNLSSNAFFTLGAGAGGGVNGAVYAITIKTKRFTGVSYPYQIFIGGAFTASTSGAAMFRMAYLDTTSGNWTAFGTGNGVNGDVYTLRYNNNLDRVYIGGAFTTSQGGAVTLNYIAYVNMTTPATLVAMYIGFNNFVYSIYSDDVDNTLYVGGTFTALAGGIVQMRRAAVYAGVQWAQMDLGVDNNIVYDIVPYKNGVLLLGTFTSVNGAAFLSNGATWFNGQSFYPTPFDTRGTGYISGAVSGDNVLYLGATWSGAAQYWGTGIVAKVNNTGTAAAAIRWQIWTNADISDFLIHCLVNATQQTQISLKNLNCQTNEIVIVDAKNGTIYSDVFGNQTRFVLGASGITNMRVLPNNNYLVAMYACSFPFIAGTGAQVSAFWKQTFNTLFDGINAI